MATNAFPVPSRSVTTAEGESRLLELLKAQGFQVLDEPVRVPVAGLRRGAACDAVVLHDGRQFAVVCKTAHRFAEWLFQWVARPILELQALHRLRGWEPLLAIAVDALEIRAVRRFRAQLAFYAPELWWVLADRAGNYALHLPEGDQDHLPERPSPGVPAGDAGLHASLAPPATLAFGDLDQLLLKVWLLGHDASPGWGGATGPVPTLRALARLAGVASPLVYRWAAAMQRSGYLRKRGRVPLLQNGDALLAEWRGRYRLTDNAALPCDPVFGMGPTFPTEFLARLRDPALQLPYAVTGHLACRAYGLTNTEARSVQVYVPGDPAAYLDALQLVPSERPVASIQLLTPRHPRSVWTGVTTVEGVAICDVLQTYLDLYHLADRGREQADGLHDRVLGGVLRAATEGRDAV